MRSRDGFLFTQATMHDVVEHFREKLREELDAVKPDDLLGRSLDDICAEIEKDHRLDVPVLKREEAGDLSVTEVDIDVRHDPLRYIRDRSRPFYVKGTAFSITVPFEGNPDLFRFGSSPYNTAIEGRVEGQVVRLAYQAIDPDPKAVKTEFDRRISQTEETLRQAAGQAAQWNSTEMPRMIRERLEQRKQKLLKDQNLAAVIGYPLKRREGETYTVPVKRKPLAIPKSPVKAEPYKPEPTLETQQYEDVLGVISNMAIALERTPSVFVDMDEEALRDFLLVMLNAIFEGQATGETFNREGKTDILIRVAGRNVFIAECKIWDGPKALTDAVDQLLRYLCWRDTKAAIIVFSRRKHFTAVLEAIAEAVKAHPNCKRQLSGYHAESTFRFVLGQKDDLNRDITLTVLAFQIPANS